MRNDVYNRYLSDYFEKISTGNIPRAEKKSILKFNYATYLPEDKNAKILEIGPGMGDFLELLILDSKYSNVVAIDLSPEVVNYCNNLFPNSTMLIKSIPEFLSDHTEEYDRIFMIHVLEHIPKTEVFPLLNAIRNSLKQNGVFIVEVPDLSNPYTGVYFRYADFTHEMGYTPSSLSYILKTSGFEITETRGFQFPQDKIIRIIKTWLQQFLYFFSLMIFKIFGVAGKPSKWLAFITVAIKRRDQ